MGAVTDRNVCLACGGFFTLKERPNCCPYCQDAYYCDNVIPDIPPAIAPYEINCCECGIKYVIETGDAKICPICKKENKVDIITSEEFQNMILVELGL